MKRISILILCLSSCRIDNTKGMAVYAIDQAHGNTVVYHVRSLQMLGSEDHIVDTTGKFKIGDTIYFKK